MTIYERIIKQALFKLDAEKAHVLAITCLKANLVPPANVVNESFLTSVIWGQKFDNPIGLAAGFDKNATAIGNLSKLGFGFIEVGTVTPRPQFGNPRPRMFRLEEDDAIINRLGFNSEGLEVFRKRLQAQKKRSLNTVVGANIGMNRDTSEGISDYVMGIRSVSEFADYIVVNISSPNTPGLRELQNQGILENLIGKILEERERASHQPPVVLKIAPDLKDQEIRQIAIAAARFKIDGFIATNTTTARPNSLISQNKTKQGGLSGRPLMAAATSVLRSLYQHTGGNIPIIGVGGVFTGEDAYLKIRSGASLVQIYSALIYRGPYVAAKIVSELSSLLKRDGYHHIKDAVGADVSL